MEALLLALGLLAVAVGRPTSGWSLIAAGALTWLVLGRLREMQLRQAPADGVLDAEVVALTCAIVVAVGALLSGA